MTSLAASPGRHPGQKQTFRDGTSFDKTETV